jgi:hypothetical protein
MILRLSQKLCTKIKAGQLHSFPLDENPFGDWSAHVFVADRKQYVIVSNTKSLYTVVMPGRGITNDRQFIEHALRSMREFLKADDQESVYDRLIAPASATVRFGKALDRSVTGSMNDMIRFATNWLIEDNLSPDNIGFKVNDLLLSAIAPSKSAKYGKPREAFKMMTNSLGP